MQITKILKRLITLIAITGSGIIYSQTTDNIDITKLLNEGRGVEAKKTLEEKINKEKSSTKKIENIKTLLEVCHLTSDNLCYAETWDKNWQLLYQELDKITKEKILSNELIMAANDNIQSKFLHRLTISPDEKIIRDLLKFTTQKVVSASRYEYAAIKTTTEAKLAALIGERELSKKYLRRSHALTLSRNLNSIWTQFALASNLETSVFLHFDAQDVKRILKALKESTSKTGANLENYLNPYVAVRLYRAMYESSILNESESTYVVEVLHKLYESIEIPKGSTLQFQKESFYAYMALDDHWGTSLPTSFSASIKFGNIENLENIDSIAIKSYLTATKGDKSTNNEKLIETINNIDNIIKKNSGQIKRSLIATNYILKSLREQSQENKEIELKYLEKYMKAQLDYFKNSGFTSLDNPPALTGLTTRIIKYAITRGLELGINSDTFKEFTLFAAININANRDSETQSSYAMLSMAESEFESELIRNYIKLKSRYSTLLTDEYIKSFLHMENTRHSFTPEGGSNPSNFEWLLNKIALAESQLIALKQRYSPFVNIDPAEFTTTDENISRVFIGEASQFSISIVNTKDSYNVKVTDFIHSKRDEVEKAIIEGEIEKKSIDAIKRSMQQMTVRIFDKDHEFKKRVEILSGPTIRGIPYTLLWDQNHNNWLIAESDIYAFASIHHIKLNSRKKYKERQTKLLAFANPKFRSSDEEAMVDRTESIIRGIKGGASSLTELPETEEEVNVLSRNLTGRKNLFFGEEANINNLASINLDNVEIFSLNTHGLMAGEISAALRPSIALTPTNKNNGIIPADKLFSLAGSPALVILSTCNSATSTSQLSSLEIDSLASAFLVKGSQNVVSSFWQVNSIGTKALMSNFAKQLSSNQNYSDALIRATRNLMADEKWEHPSIWASFAMLGATIQNDNKDDRSSSPTFVMGSMVNVHEGKESAILLRSEYLNDEFIFSPALAINDTDKIKIKENPFKDTSGVLYTSRSHSNENKLFIQNGNIIRTFDSQFSSPHKTKCDEIKISSDWLMKDIIELNDYFVFHVYRTSESSYEHGLLQLRKSNCEQKTLGPFIYKNIDPNQYDSTVLLTSRENNFLLILSTPPAKAEAFPGPYLGELGFGTICKYSSFSLLVLLDENLNQVKSTVAANLRFIGENNFVREEISLIWKDPCTSKSYAASVSYVQLLVDNDVERQRHILGEVRKLHSFEETISSQFESIEKWWISNDGESYVVEGAILNLAQFNSDEMLKDLEFSSYINWIRTLNGVFVYSKRDNQWRKVTSLEKCEVSGTFALDNSFFYYCNDFTNAKSERKIKIFHVQ